MEQYFKSFILSFLLLFSVASIQAQIGCELLRELGEDMAEAGTTLRPFFESPTNAGGKGVKTWEKLIYFPTSRINISILTRRLQFDELATEWKKINPHSNKEMFHSPSGGYVAQHTGHNVILGDADNIAEFHMAEAFAKENKVVKLLNESMPPGIKTPDAEIEGLGIFDFKNIRASATQIETNVRTKILGATTQADNIALNLGDNVDAIPSRINQGILDAINTADASGLSLPTNIGVVYKYGTTKILTVQQFRHGERF